MQHEVTTRTKFHEGDEWGADPVHEFQLLTYLRLSRRWMGLFINFNTDRIKHGLRRMLNG